jgi:hypothetical protein
LIHSLKYRVLPTRLAVCRLAADSLVPPWATRGEFFSVTRTDEELSIVCAQDVYVEHSGAQVERGWLALKLEGPFPLSLTGVLASFVEPLAASRIAVFAIATFDTDYVLIRRESLADAVRALANAGHVQIGEATA